MIKYILSFLLLEMVRLTFVTSSKGQSIVNIKIVDEEKKPIYGVYANINNDFYYTNDSGIISIASKNYSYNDSIQISHISYESQCFKINTLLNDKSPIIYLHPNIGTLDAVTIRSSDKLDETEFVKSAINSLNINYEPVLYHKNLNLNTDIDIFCNSEQKELIKFKGLLTLRKNGTHKTLVSKKVDAEYVDNKAKDYFFSYNPITLRQ